MPDPLTGWLSHVDLLLAYVAGISVSLALIFHNVDRVLGSMLSICNRVRRTFKRVIAVTCRSRKRTAKRRTKKRGRQKRRTST